MAILTRCSAALSCFCNACCATHQVQAAASPCCTSPLHSSQTQAIAMVPTREPAKSHGNEAFRGLPIYILHITSNIHPALFLVTSTLHLQNLHHKKMLHHCTCTEDTSVRRKVTPSLLQTTANRLSAKLYVLKGIMLTHNC